MILLINFVVISVGMMFLIKNFEVLFWGLFYYDVGFGLRFGLVFGVFWLCFVFGKEVIEVELLLLLLLLLGD